MKTNEECKKRIEETKENICPKCNSEDLIFYPLAYFHDYKCNSCKYRFNEE